MGPFIILDTETTGLDSGVNKIIELGALKWQDGKILDRYESLYNPGVPIPYEVVLLTGIKNEDVESAPKFSEKRHEIADFIGDLPIVGHNIAFDTGFLHSHHVRGENMEIDTCALARILLPNEASYSLEVVMRHHGLPIRASHRAMADTETTLDFFVFLMELIKGVPQEAHDDLRKIFEKSDWWGKPLFEEMLDSSPFFSQLESRSPKIGKKETAANISAACPANGGAKNWSSAITQKLKESDHLLIESNGIPDFANIDKPLVIGYKSALHKDSLVAAAESSGLSTSELLSPSFYLAPKKVQKIIESRELTDTGTQFLIKILLWRKKTDNGCRDTLRLDRDSFGLFDFVADHEAECEYWKKALESAKKSDVVFVNHSALANEIGVHLEERTCLITEASALENSFTDALSYKYSITTLAPYFKEKADILMGLVGIFYEKHGSSGGGEDLMLQDHLRETVEWKRVESTMENLPESTKKTEILAALSNKTTTLQWISSFAEQITINIVPHDINGTFNEAIAPFSKVSLLDGALALAGDDNYIKTILGLGSDWQLVNDSSFHNLEIITKGDLPHPMSEGYFTATTKFYRDLIEKHRGGLLLLLNSRKTVDAVFEALLHDANEAEIRLLAIGRTGGAGKCTALFAENPETSVFLATPTMLSHLDEIKDKIKVIAFQKVPFDFPGNPLVEARSASFQNGFMNYSLPRAVLNFKSLLAKLDGGPNQQKKCYLLDPRLWTKDYGKWFI